MDIKELKASILEAKKTDWYSSANLRTLITEPEKFSWWDRCGISLEKEFLSEFNNDVILNELDNKPRTCDLRSNRFLDFGICILSCLLTSFVLVQLDYFFWPLILASAYFYYSDRFKLIWSIVVFYVMLVSMGLVAVETSDQNFVVVLLVPLFSIVIRNWFSTIAEPRYSLETMVFRDSWIALLDKQISDLNSQLGIFKRIKHYKASLRKYFDIVEYHFVGKKQDEYLPVFYPAFANAIIILLAGVLSIVPEEGFGIMLVFAIISSLINVILYYSHYQHLGLNRKTKVRMALYVCFMGLFISVILAGVCLFFILAALLLFYGGIQALRDWEAERGIRQWSIDYFRKSKDPLKWI